MRPSITGLMLAALLAHPSPGHAIPAFARKYRTSCSTCHTAAPKLNVMGEAFRLNGYRFPENDQLLRKEPPVPLGEEPWEELWPRAIYPADLPGSVPLAIRVQTDLTLTRERGGSSLAFRFPHEAYVLAGATFGRQFSAFLETEWSHEEGLEVVQAKVAVQDVIPGLPSRLLNLWVGRQSLYLLTFGERQIDRMAREPFEWQRFEVSQLRLDSAAPGSPLRSQNEFSLESSQAALEVNGLFRRRIHYAAGISQGAGDGPEDNNDRKDFYWRLRYKLGGLALDGSYDEGGGPLTGSGGQLLDRGLILEHFGYLGEEWGGADRPDRHRAFGVAARWLFGRLDLGGGYVWGSHDDPWGLDAGAVRQRSVFGKGEYMVFPWLFGSLKAERFTVEQPTLPASSGYVTTPYRMTRFLPGVVALVRQNVRWVVEAEFFPDWEVGTGQDPRPTALRTRLDVAF